MLCDELDTTLREMPSGTHAMLVYDSMDNKRDVLFNFLKMGMDQEGLVYACSEESPQRIRGELAWFGVNVPRLESKGILSVKNYDEVYMVDGKVDSLKIIQAVAGLAREYSKMGLKGLRGVGEMSCFIREKKVDALLEYERMLKPSFWFPGKAICAYNLVELETSGNLEILWPVIKAHKTVIMTGPRGGFALSPERVDGDAFKAAGLRSPQAIPAR
jgi:MEDS: MEthanogen/methylotroph, DcmR Sensory domain